MTLKVKFVSKNPMRAFQLRTAKSAYAHINYTQDPKARDYDWLVVYDDLPPEGDERFPMNCENLDCPPENTILLTYEPSSVKVYGHDYTHQYGIVLTSHEAALLAHPFRRDAPPVGMWYYGDDTDVAAHPSPPNKSEALSLFMSAKADKHTMHALRYRLLEACRSHFGASAEYFGWQERYVEKKAEGLDPFRYTIAVENHIGPHHWTEKLSDAFLGHCLPFYAGCPNAAEYFPEGSFVAIDMRDPEEAISKIEAAMRNGLYEKSLPAIVEARRRVIEEYTLPNIIGAAILEATELPIERRFHPSNGGVILSRRRCRLQHPLAVLRYGYEKVRNRRYFARQNKQLHQN